MIKQHIWTIWTAMSSVPKKADKLSLSHSRSRSCSRSRSHSRLLKIFLHVTGQGSLWHQPINNIFRNAISWCKIKYLHAHHDYGYWDFHFEIRLYLMMPLGAYFFHFNKWNSLHFAYLFLPIKKKDFLGCQPWILYLVSGHEADVW